MGYRFHGRANVDPTRPRAWATCDRCGFNFNHHQLRFQFDFRGPRLMNTQALVCQPCYDAPQDQLRPVILPPDPVPIRNPRPEPYAENETDFRVTQDGSNRTTQTGDKRTLNSDVEDLP